MKHRESVLKGERGVWSLGEMGVERGREGGREGCRGGWSTWERRVGVPERGV